MKYEVNIDELIIVTITLLCKEIDMNVKPFETYDTTTSRMTLEKKVTNIDNKKKRLLEGKNGEGQLQITKEKGEDEDSKDEAKTESSKGKALAVAEPKETK